MAESIVIVNFEVESEAFQVFSELKQASVNPDFVISQAGIVKQEAGQYVLKDQFDTGIETTDDTQRGGIIGSLIGILGGPVGILLGGGIGSLIGSAVDHADIADNASLIEKVCELIPEGKAALVALVSELDESVLDEMLNKYHADYIRLDAAEVAYEVEQAEELQKKLAKEARQKLREEKKKANKEKIEEHRAKLKAEFEARKAKLKKKS